MKGFSSKTQLNNQFKLSDLARNLSMNREEKEEFKQVESITLTHALNNETTGLKSTERIELICIYLIKLKGKYIPFAFMKVLDKKTKAQTVFEIDWGGGHYTYIMGNKKVADTIGIGEYIQRETKIEWEQPQKNVKTLEELYLGLIAFVVKLTQRETDTPDRLFNRKKRICELEKEVAKLQSQMNAEKQPKFKMEIADKIKKLNKKKEEEK